MEHWSDASEDSDRFGQFLDNLNWLVFVELLPGKTMRVFSNNVYEMRGLLQKPQIVSKTQNASSNGSTAEGVEMNGVP